MGYVSGTRTLQSNSAEDFYAVIAAQLGAHGNWTFVEDVSTASYKYSVWRCGALNSTGAPFYAFFSRLIAGGTSLGFGMAEDYDEVAHTFQRGAPAAGTTARVPAADYSITAASTALYNAAAGGVNMLVQSLVLDPSSYDYWLAINNDGFWCGARVGVGAVQGVVVGTFDSLVQDPATNDPRPLVIGHNAANSTSAAYTVTTRHPFAAGSQGYWWGAYEWYTNLTWPSAALSGSVGSNTGDLFQGTKAIGARMLLRTFAMQRSQLPQTFGSNRGLYRHMLYFNVATGVTVGDTITIGGTTWVYTGKTGIFYEASAA